MSTTNATPNLIATLESYLSPSLNVPLSPPSPHDPSLPALHLLTLPTLNKLRNVGPARIKDMRHVLGHSHQIISHIPIAAPPQACIKLNDALYAAIRLNTERFSGMALLPGGRGEGREAARELQRCVSKYGFVGGVLGLKRGMDAGGAVNDASFEMVWEIAVKCRVPIALRELWPAVGDMPDYQHNLPDSVLAPLLRHTCTSQSVSPLPFLQLYLSSVFDRHPTLRLMLCHPGLLPALLPRIEVLLADIPAADKPKRSYLDVWQHNIYLTTADVQDMSSMRTLIELIPMDRVLYSSNYPLEERKNTLMEELRDNKFLTKEEWERIAWKNAAALFGLKGTAERGEDGRKLIVPGRLASRSVG